MKFWIHSEITIGREGEQALNCKVLNKVIKVSSALILGFPSKIRGHLNLSLSLEGVSMENDYSGLLQLVRQSVSGAFVFFYSVFLINVMTRLKIMKMKLVRLQSGKDGQAE